MLLFHPIALVRLGAKGQILQACLQQQPCTQVGGWQEQGKGFFRICAQNCHLQGNNTSVCFFCIQLEALILLSKGWAGRGICCADWLGKRCEAQTTLSEGNRQTGTIWGNLGNNLEKIFSAVDLRYRPHQPVCTLQSLTLPSRCGQVGTFSVPCRCHNWCCEAFFLLRPLYSTKTRAKQCPAYKRSVSATQRRRRN